jgi:hypothetical protein
MTGEQVAAFLTDMTDCKIEWDPPAKDERQSPPSADQPGD